MQTVCEMNKCTGCMACIDICSQNAIHVQDSLDAYNAVIDNNKCIKCMACHRVCQVNNPVNLKKPVSWFQGWTKDEDNRSQCSSGGIASELSRTMIEMDGVVCSCMFVGGDFIFYIADKKSKLKHFKGSKYVKSNPVGVYRELAKVLRITMPSGRIKKIY